MYSATPVLGQSFDHPRRRHQFADTRPQDQQHGDDGGHDVDDPSLFGRVQGNLRSAGRSARKEIEHG